MVIEGPFLRISPRSSNVGELTSNMTMIFRGSFCNFYQRFIFIETYHFWTHMLSGHMIYLMGYVINYARKMYVKIRHLDFGIWKRSDSIFNCYF